MSTVDHAIDRAWRGWADARRVAQRAGSSKTALRSIGSPRRRRLDDWMHRTSYWHHRYQAEHPPASRRAAVVCVSMRPHLLDLVVANIERQAGLDLEVVFVANDTGFGEIDLAALFQTVGGATVVHTEPGTTLGSALNLGIAATDERFVAKFDDDDWYGTDYLLDSLRAHGYAGAGVVGKHSYYADVEATGERYLRFPGHEFAYSGTLAGGTLVIDRDRIGDVRFDDISLGEDRGFLVACHRRGISTFSADRFGFVQRRGTDNTWTVSTDDFLVGSLRVDPDHPDHRLDRRQDGHDGGAT